MIKKFGLITTVLLLTVAGAAFVFQKARAQQRDNLEYNAVYECGSSGSRFKVLSCKGPNRLDRCEVFFINEHSPGGGFKDTISRSQVDDRINGGCKMPGGPAANYARDDSEKSVATADKNQASATPNNKTDNVASCFASDPDSDGKSANEKTFRGVLRRFWEKEPKESGPTVTITFQKMTIGAPRRWRATFDDAYSQADPSKPIYPVRAAFTTCSDYTDAITKRKMERIYDCYWHKTGGWQCTQTGASGPLAMKDEKEYIPKKRQ